MGLESATHIQDLDSSNPLAGDKKNQGDDHLRLLKAVLRTDFPNADRAFRFPEALSKSANYGVVSTDENKTILCDTTAGAFTLTLPTPTFDGWLVKVIKTSTDVNPVYVAPPSGTINGLAKMRCNVPFVEYVFFYTGSTFIRVKAPGEEAPGTFSDFGGTTAPVGHAFPTGQSLVAADHPELFAIWGYTWGGGGANFSAPDLRDKFLTQAGSTYALAGVGGAQSVTLDTSQIPSHSHANTLNDTGHSHTANGSLVKLNAAGNLNIGIGTSGDGGGLVQSATTGVTIVNVAAGGGGAHENRPPYTAVNRIFRLC